MVLLKNLTNITVADKDVYWCWQCWPLQAEIVRIKTFGRSFRTSLVDIYNCLRAKDLKSAWDNSFEEKCPRLQRCLQLQQRGNKPLFKIRRIRGNPFILVNNIVIGFWTIAISTIFYSKCKCCLLFVDMYCIFLSIDKNAH